MSIPYTFDPARDLQIERFIDVPVELVWKACTEPEHLKAWHCPKPWSVSACEIDLRPGGIFSTTARSPEGEEHPHLAVYLEVLPHERLVWTDALLPGFRPAEKGILGSMFLTAIITMTPEGTGTRYKAVVLHSDPACRKQHEEMGFQDGWGTVLDQLAEYVKTMAS